MAVIFMDGSKHWHMAGRPFFFFFFPFAWAHRMVLRLRGLRGMSWVCCDLMVSGGVCAGIW